MKLGIIGSGDLGELIAYHAVTDGHYEVAGFFDDFADPVNAVTGLPVLGKLAAIEQMFIQKAFDVLMVGIGYKHFAFRKLIFEKYEKIVPMGTIIHSSAYVDKSSVIGTGSIILPGVIIDKHVQVGKNVLMNTASTIAHDTIIMSHCFIAPRAAIAGKVLIEECCMIGINSTIIDNIHICSNTVVGGGAVVIKNITEPGLYAGVPARNIKRDN